MLLILLLIWRSFPSIFHVLIPERNTDTVVCRTNPASHILNWPLRGIIRSHLLANYERPKLLYRYFPKVRRTQRPPGKGQSSLMTNYLIRRPGTVKLYFIYSIHFTSYPLQTALRKTNHLKTRWRAYPYPSSLKTIPHTLPTLPKPSHSTGHKPPPFAHLPQFRPLQKPAPTPPLRADQVAERPSSP